MRKIPSSCRVFKVIPTIHLMVLNKETKQKKTNLSSKSRPLVLTGGSQIIAAAAAAANNTNLVIIPLLLLL